MMSSIESEDPNHLADEYVEEFVLDHLDVSVKRENNQPPLPVRQQQPPPPPVQPTQPQPDGDRLPPMPLTSTSGTIMIQSPPPHHHLLTPPSQQAEDYNGAGLTAMTVGNQQHHGHHNGVVIKQNMMYPGTPPDTPPVSISPPPPPPPHAQHPGSSPHPHQFFHLDQQQHPHIQHRPNVEDMMWLQQSVRIEPQPLDLRPNCGADHNGNMDPGWMPPHHATVIAGGKRLPLPHDYVHAQDVGALSPLGLSRPVSVGSVSTLSPVMVGPGSVSHVPSGRAGRHGSVDAISDKELVHLTVRDLNKRLHGYPRDVVVRLKQKRRTLKNRGYAQNCRTKRVNQRHQLEMQNRALQAEMQRIKSDLGRMTQERDYYRQRCDVLRHALSSSAGCEGSDGIHSNPSSPEFLL